VGSFLDCAKEIRQRKKGSSRKAYLCQEKLEKDKVIAEDEKFTGHDDIQKVTDKYIAKIEEVLATKEKEITEI